MDDELKVFAGRSNPALADDVCACLGITRSSLTLSRFSNDNLSVQIDANVRERDVFVVQAFTEPASDHIMELLITLDALRSASARRITAVIPYFSLRPLGQEGPAAHLHRRPLDRGPAEHRRRPSGADDGPARGTGPRLLQHSGRPPHSDPHRRRTHGRQIRLGERGGGGERRRGSEARRPLRIQAGRAARHHRQAPGQRHRGAPRPRGGRSGRQGRHRLRGRSLHRRHAGGNRPHAAPRRGRARARRRHSRRAGGRGHRKARRLRHRVDDRHQHRGGRPVETPRHC